MILCFVTNNQYKLEEISRLVKTGIKIISLKDIGCLEEIPENFPTIRENSKAKAKNIFDRYFIDCFADDTGLEVDALNGEPGVHSARFAGPGKNPEDNIRLLLKKLENIQNRAARFRTVITLILKGEIRQFEGVAEGTITRSPRGSKGFGYDPVFLPAGSDQTFAEMPLDRKNLISHRALATGKLIKFLNSLDDQQSSS